LVTASEMYGQAQLYDMDLYDSSLTAPGILWYQLIYHF